MEFEKTTSLAISVTVDATTAKRTPLFIIQAGNAFETIQIIQNNLK